MWDTNKIIAVGLVVMGVIAVTVWGIISYQTGTSTGTEIPIGIISGLAGVLTSKKLAEYEMQSKQNKTAETLGKVAETATQAQTAINAVETIGNVLKK